MIKARAGEIIVLGLSDNNMEKLKAGKPMEIDLAEMGVPGGFKIFLFNGRNEETMQRDFKELIHPLKTTIIDHRTTGTRPGDKN